MVRIQYQSKQWHNVWINFKKFFCILLLNPTLTQEHTLTFNIQCVSSQFWKAPIKNGNWREVWLILVSPRPIGAHGIQASRFLWSLKKCEIEELCWSLKMRISKVSSSCEFFFYWGKITQTYVDHTLSSSVKSSWRRLNFLDLVPAVNFKIPV